MGMIRPSMLPARTVLAVLRRTGVALLDLLFPRSCSGCGQLGVFFCSACLERIEVPSARNCARCGSIAVLDLCTKCGGSFALDRLTSVAVFQPPIQRAIHDLKFNGVRELARPLGELMAREWPKAGLQADVLVPVPLHTRRVKERGYNQTVLLARVLGEAIGVSVDERLIERCRNTRPQVGLGQAERHSNVAGAFVAVRTAPVGRIMLVDDVCTTGATLEACAAALKRAGAVAVEGFTLTRARRPDFDYG